MNVFYESDTPFGTTRLTLLVNHTHYLDEVINEINPLSVWFSFDKRRQSPVDENILTPPFRRYIEVSWEFQPGMSLERARILLRRNQGAEEISAQEVLRRTKDDPAYQQAYQQIA